MKYISLYEVILVITIGYFYYFDDITIALFGQYPEIAVIDNIKVHKDELQELELEASHK
jgi:hypothetical protein